MNELLQESISLVTHKTLYLCICVSKLNKFHKFVPNYLLQESISLVTPDNIDSKMLTSLGSEKMVKKENGSQDQIGETTFSLFFPSIFW